MPYTGRQLGNIYRDALANELKPKYGSYRRQGSRWISFASMKVLVLYSKYYDEQEKYWYGIEKEDWENWGSKDHLCLLMPSPGYIDEISPKVRYLHLLPGSALQILPRLSQDYRGQKKIDIYFISGHVDINREPLSWVKTHVDQQEFSMQQNVTRPALQKGKAEIIETPLPVQSRPNQTSLERFLNMLPKSQAQIALNFDEFTLKTRIPIPANAHNQNVWWNNKNKEIRKHGWMIQDVYFKVQKVVLRRTGSYPLREIPEYIQMLLGETERQWRVDPNTLKNWLRFCKQVGWFFEGTVIYEKGLGDTNGLGEGDRLIADEDYNTCKREILRHKQK